MRFFSAYQKKNTIKKMNMQITNWERNIWNTYFEKVTYKINIQKIYKELIQIKSKKRNNKKPKIGTLCKRR